MSHHGWRVIHLRTAPSSFELLCRCNIPYILSTSGIYLWDKSSLAHAHVRHEPTAEKMSPLTFTSVAKYINSLKLLDNTIKQVHSPPFFVSYTEDLSAAGRDILTAVTCCCLITASPPDAVITVTQYIL